MPQTPRTQKPLKVPLSSEDRAFPHTVPLCFRIVQGAPPELCLAPGVQVAVSREEIKRRFEAECVKGFFTRYREAGGDTLRLKPLLTCLLPITAPKPPTQTALRQMVRRAFETLDKLLRLPEIVPWDEGRKILEEAADILRRFDEHAQKEYLAQFKSHTPSQYAVEIPARVIPGPLFRSVIQGGSASLLLSYPESDRSLQFPLVPPLGAPGRGRIRSGSQTGLIIGVLAEECQRRFKAPPWPEILEICKAIAPETFDPKVVMTEVTVKHLKKRVARAKKDKGQGHILALHRLLFPVDLP